MDSQSRLVLLLVCFLVIVPALAAIGHYDYGYKVVGPNECELDYSSNHVGFDFSVETKEPSRSASQFGCLGVAGKVSYFFDGEWQTWYKSDLRKPYNVYQNGVTTNSLDWVKHLGKDYYNSFWYSYFKDH